MLFIKLFCFFLISKDFCWYIYDCFNQKMYSNILESLISITGILGRFFILYCLFTNWLFI